MRSPSALPPPEDGGRRDGGGTGGGRLTNQMHGLNRRQGEKEETDKGRGERCKSEGLPSLVALQHRAAQRMLISGKLMSI